MKEILRKYHYWKEVYWNKNDIEAEVRLMEIE